MIKVEGYQNLYRDEKTGAIVNCDTVSYEQYLKSLSYRQSQKDEISSMKSEIMELKSLVKELLNGSR
jgi:hypothetical protein|tara:strand:- start:536 stop:736 length:201 start_codon:yes stop_codon:yes gene_type:complete